MQKVLSAEQKVQLAGEMYEYISGIDHIRTQVLEGYADEFKTTEAYAREQIKGRRALKEIQADWVISQIWGMVTVKKLREFFLKLFDNTPEHFGYEVPVYEMLPFDVVQTIPDKNLFRDWKSKKLLKKTESL